MLFARFIYSISWDWLLAIIDVVAGILIPKWWNKQDLKWLIILFAILLVIHYYFDIVREYKRKEYGYRKLSDEILNSCTILTNAISDQTTDSTNHSSIFQFSAQAVCAEIYNCLQNYYGCEFRVSVIQQFYQTGTKTKCKMIGRKSKSKLSNNNHKTYSVKRNSSNYYYVELLINNDDSIIVLPTEVDVNKKFKYNKKKHSKVQQYIAMPAFAFSEKIAFILQIDCMEKHKLGKDVYDIESFAKRFLYPYLSILVSAYQQERSLTKQ